MGLGFGLRRRLEDAAVRHPRLRCRLARAHLIASAMFGRGRAHPIDARYAIATQAPVPLYLLKVGGAADAHMIPYAGCVPSVLRRVIETLPLTAECSFVDLGCGKGRALAIATEYAFRRILGIELNPELAAVARRNVRRIAGRHPERTRPVVILGDASAPALPDGDLVVFLYHPFGQPLVERLADQLRRAAATGDRTIHIVYENPVHGDVFDAADGFGRIAADMWPCADDERAFAFDAVEAVAVWRIGGRRAPPPAPMRAIRVTKPGYRAVIAPPG